MFEDQQVEEVIEESLKMMKLNHRNVMDLLGVCLDAGPAPFIVLPYMKNGSVYNYLKQNRTSLLLSKQAEDEQVSDLLFLSSS